MKTVGFIDYYLDEFHANHYPEWLKEVSGGELEVKYAYAKVDSPNEGGLTTEQWCEKYGIQRVESIEELIEKSDCINVLSPDNPEMHEELCALALKSGKPVYVDKTFADTREIAARIFAIAEKSSTPCFSASALRFAQEYEQIKPEEVDGIVSEGPGPLEQYSIHQLEPIIALMGPKASRVLYTGTAAHPAGVIEFEDGRRAFISHHDWDCPFAVTIDKKSGGTFRTEIQSDYFMAFMREMADFFLNGTPKVSHEDTIAVIAVREALVRAAGQPGTWVSVYA